MSYAGVDAYESEHKALQRKLTRLSSDTEYRVARYASHVIDAYDPWLVIDEIKALVNRLPR
jgi:hypothetical protein